MHVRTYADTMNCVMAGNSCAPRAVIPTAAMPPDRWRRPRIRTPRTRPPCFFRTFSRPAVHRYDFPGLRARPTRPGRFFATKYLAKYGKTGFSVRLLLSSGRAPVRWWGRTPGERRNSVCRQGAAAAVTAPNVVIVTAVRIGAPNIYPICACVYGENVQNVRCSSYVPLPVHATPHKAVCVRKTKNSVDALK